MNAFALPAVRPGAPPMDFAAARAQMLECQIRPGAIIHPGVLAAVARTPREAYLPPALAARAYSDQTLAWDDGFLLDPTLCARALEHAAAAPVQHALVIESGAGYLAALAAHVFEKVTVLFPDVGPAKVALNNYVKAGYTNVTVKSGLLARGWSRSAPYQAVLLAGGSASVPEAWVEQLSDGGRITGFFPDETGLVKLRVQLKLHSTLSARTVADGPAPFLPGLAPPAVFRF